MSWGEWSETWKCEEGPFPRIPTALEAEMWSVVCEQFAK